MSFVTAAVGGALAAAGWAAARAVARTKLKLDIGLMLDAAVPTAVGAALLALTARPAFSGLVVFALLGGLAVADHFKRETLKEPVVFSDRAELLELVRHPELYLPFVGPLRVMAGAGVILLALAAVPWLEAPAFALPWSLRLAAPALLLAVAAAVMWPLLPATRALRRLGPAGEPGADSARFGPVATLFIYGLIARGERVERRNAVCAAADAGLPALSRPGGHVVLIQAESFLDVRRHWLKAPPDLLPAFDALKANAAGGLMSAPTWGANTVRTEFEALAGAPLTALGLDGFNPYDRFARQPMPSLASRLRDAGYDTICLHPYDRRFYGRDRVLPRLGFRRFQGGEAFGRPTEGGYVTDAELATAAECVLHEATRPTFLFLITMENHGPWRAEAGDVAPGAAAYLRGLRAADALLGRMAAAVEPSGGVVAFYGDHAPMLPGLEPVQQTDWLVRGPHQEPGREDIGAHDIAARVLRAI